MRPLTTGLEGTQALSIHPLDNRRGQNAGEREQPVENWLWGCQLKIPDLCEWHLKSWWKNPVEWEDTKRARIFFPNCELLNHTIKPVQDRDGSDVKVHLFGKNEFFWIKAKGNFSNRKTWTLGSQQSPCTLILALQRREGSLHVLIGFVLRRHLAACSGSSKSDQEFCSKLSSSLCILGNSHLVFRS